MLFGASLMSGRKGLALFFKRKNYEQKNFPLRRESRDKNSCCFSFDAHHYRRLVFYRIGHVAAKMRRNGFAFKMP